MKNQYVGDIGDYGKYGLLRFLAGRGIKIGVNWYLTENDGSSDGRFTDYLLKPEGRICDPVLFDTLKEIAFRSDKTVRMVEAAGIIPGAEFFSETLKSSCLEPEARAIHRRLWFNNSTLMTQDADLIFADPDNGISYRKTATAKDSEKHILPEEVAAYYNSGKNVVYYCHRGRRKNESWEQVKTGIRKQIRDAQILVLTFHRGTQRSYIFAVHPDQYLKYCCLLSEFLESKWGSMFTGEPVSGNVFPTDTDTTGNTATVYPEQFYCTHPAHRAMNFLKPIQPSAGKALSETDKKTIENAIAFVRDLFRTNSGGHDADHTLRVFRNTLLIAEKEPDCDVRIAAQAALLHDVDDHKLFATKENANARKFLKDSDVPQQTIDRICEVINSVSFSQNKGLAPGTPEGRVVQDADRLDALGAVGIARTFAYGGEHGRPMQESVQHFYDKLLKLRSLMNTETGKRIAEKRHIFLEEFLKEYYEETGAFERIGSDLLF